MDRIYANFSGCTFLAGGNMTCGGKWARVDGRELDTPAPSTYAYGVYGTQGDLQCGIDFGKYVKQTFNPQYAPVKRPRMDGGLESVAPVEPMPARLLERFLGVSEAEPAVRK